MPPAIRASASGSQSNWPARIASNLDRRLPSLGNGRAAAPASRTEEARFADEAAPPYKSSGPRGAHPPGRESRRRADASAPRLRAMAFVPPARHLLRAKDLADARYSEPLEVDDLAAAAGLSRAHFSREFRRTFGESPHAYLLTGGWSGRRRCCAPPTTRSPRSAWRSACRASAPSRPASSAPTA